MWHARGTMHFDSALKAWRSPTLSVGLPRFVKTNITGLPDNLSGFHTPLHVAISPPRSTPQDCIVPRLDDRREPACSEAPARPRQRAQ